MCGIIGAVNKENASEIIAKGLSIIKNRGRDGFGIYDFDKISIAKDISDIKAKKTRNAIGHCLHSIVSNVSQPLKLGNDYLVINCEIYNWKELAEKYKLDARNDAELVLYLLEKKKAEDVIEELDGVYAFAYLNHDKLILARDIFGEKPLWFSDKDGFSFCSEKKGLEKQGIKDIEELNPRNILIYDMKTSRINFVKRKFFEIKPEHKKSYEELKKKVKGYLINSIAKRIPDQKIGILFSGGVDSALIALICRQLGVDFTCYTAALKDGNFQDAQDMVYAKKVAERYGFELKTNLLSLDEAERCVKEVAQLIEDNTVVKVGVGLTFYAACKAAQKDRIRVMFSGLGAEEIFAGYERHKHSSNINNECISGLLKIYERDLYRDDVVTMNHNIELRLPFLDKELVRYSLKIPGKYKLNDEMSKIILRDIAFELGLEKEFAYRKKIGAQYGSKFSRAIEKLAKKSGFSTQAEYLSQFYTQPNVKIAALVSGGKDSLFAAYTMKMHNYSIECFVCVKSDNPHSYMYHTPNIDLVEMQAEAAGIPIIIEKTKGVKEKELLALKNALRKAKEKYRIEGVVSGALFSNYQRERIDKICDSLGLKNFTPLWHIDQELEMRYLLKNNFVFILSSVACDGLDKSWLGRVITAKDVDKLVEINKKIGINVAFEGGEAETLVLDCPLFKKSIEVKDSRIIMESECCGRFDVKKAVLSDKK